LTRFPGEQTEIVHEFGGEVVKPPSDSIARQLLGKRVLFKQDESHHSCWHYQVGLKTGVVLRLGQSLAEKAERIGSSELLHSELLSTECEIPRLWIKADPCPALPRGCEAAVEFDCLQVQRNEGGTP
jgi:hypothetical protein